MLGKKRIGKAIFGVALCGTLLLAACEIVEPASEPEEESEETPPAAVEEPEEEPNSPQYVFVDAVEVLLLESFPLQATAIVTGNLSDPCVTLVGSASSREGNVFTVSLEAVRDEEAICGSVLVPFEESVSLDILDLPAGEYTVIAGETSTTFTLEMDNSFVELEPTDGFFVTDPPSVETLEVQFVAENPLQAEAAISGTTPGACDYVVAGAERDGSTFTINIEGRVPEGIDCIEGPGEFSETVYIDIVGLEAGTYTVIAGDLTSEIILAEDNIPPDEPASLGDPLPVGSFTVDRGTDGTTALVNIQLVVPNGCIDFLEVQEQREGNIITLDVYQNVPPTVSCLQALTDAEIAYELTDLVAGSEYTVTMGDMARLYIAE